MVSTQQASWLKVGNFNVKLERTSKQTQSALGLASREITFLTLLAQGHGLKSIARAMEISPHTADTYRRRVYEKLGVNSAACAVLIAVAHYAGATIEYHDQAAPPFDEAA